MPAPIVHSEQTSELVRLNATEFLRSFRLPQNGGLGWLARTVARIPAAQLAVQMIEFDRLVGSHGLTAGGNYLLETFTKTLAIERNALVPRHGPLLVVSNHPGMIDAMALWHALDTRDDLLTMARDQRLLRLLPNICRHLILVAPNAHAAALRQAIAHLRGGGALLTFPAGVIEPDPAIHDVPISETRWSGSIELLVRAVPGLTLVPAAVGGVISRSALRHPLAAWFRADADREWAAATLQVLFASYRDTQTRLVLGAAIETNTLARGEAGARVVAEMNRLLRRAQRGWE